MTHHEPLLRIRFDGEAVGPGRIPVPQLLSFLSGMNKAMRRVGRILHGGSGERNRGRLPRGLEEDIRLELVSLAPGSPAAVLGLDRCTSDLRFPGMDEGEEILERTLAGLEAVQLGGSGDALPVGYDSGVLRAWQETGTIFGQGITKVSFTLGHRTNAIKVSLTSNGIARIRNRIHGPVVGDLTIEGRMTMADFGDKGIRCRIHPSVGDAVLCQFDEAHSVAVFDNILGYVRVVGEAIEQSASGRITSIKVREFKPLGDRYGNSIDQPHHKAIHVSSFWDSPSLEELVRHQNVRPLDIVEDLFGTWPGDDDDGFEAAIDELRHPGEGTGFRK